MPFLDSIQVALRTFDGKHFLSAQNGGGGEVLADATEIRNWEKFTMSGRPEYGGKISLKTFDGKHFLTAKDGGGGKVLADATEDREWETFTIILQDKSNLNVPSAPIPIPADPINRVMMLSKVAFQTFDGKHFLSAQNGGGSTVNAVPYKDLQWEGFTIYILP